MVKGIQAFGLEKNQVQDNYLDACEIIYDKTECRELRKPTNNILYQ
ncbi:MAG: hypothetical protein Crog4KO_36750 [Crocinitomicaceae bacterium]